MSITNLQTGRFTSFPLLVMGLLLLNTSQVMAQQNVTFHIQQQTKEPVDAATLIITDQKTGKVVANGLTEADGKLSCQLTDGVTSCIAEPSDAVTPRFSSPFPTTTTLITSTCAQTEQNWKTL